MRKSSYRIFPELGAMMVFSIEYMERLVAEQGRSGLFEYIGTNIKKLMNKGYMFPIYNVEDGLYSVEVHKESNVEGRRINSEGAIGIIGLGYLYDYDYDELIEKKKLVRLDLEEGKYSFGYEVDNKVEVIKLNIDLLSRKGS